MTNNQPKQKFRAGGVTATIWENEHEKNGKYYTVNVERSYKDKEGNWATTSQMRTNDLPKLALVTAQAYEYVIQHVNEE